MMKKAFTILVLSILLLCVLSLTANAHSIDLDFYEMFEEHGSVMLLIDAETGVIEHANPAASEFYGYTVQELESMKIHQINVLSQEEIKKRMETAAKEKRNYYILEQRLASGEIRTVEVYSCPHIHGDKTLLFATIHDITDKTRLQERNQLINNTLISVLSGVVVLICLFSFILNKNLKKVKARNHEIETFNRLRKTFVDSSDKQISLKDEHLKYIFVNKSLADFFRRKESEIIGKGDFDLASKEFASIQNKSDLAVLEKKTLIIDEAAIENRVYKTTKFPVKLLNGNYGVGTYIEDITKEQAQRQRIEYLSYHDELTGLYNRSRFEEELKRIDVEENLPISILSGDMNGLKLANDIFGHEAGDMLLKSAAKVLKKVCRKKDIIARVGGDEFAVLLPGTSSEDAEKIMERIRDEFSRIRVKAIHGSISMGCDTKTHKDEGILQTLKVAESRMYSVKAMDRSKIKSSTIKTIIEELHRNSPKEKTHSKNVSEICESIGRHMHLPEHEVRRLKEAGYLHDIGKIGLDEGVLHKDEMLADHIQNERKQHAVIGYRILNSFDDTVDLAESILAHHEKWDGTGYPKGLKGEEIPKSARVIAIAETYDAMISRNGTNAEEAVQEIKKQAGCRFDPEIVDAFVGMMADKDGKPYP